jgi:nicotinamidase/pyrazinamidase
MNSTSNKSICNKASNVALLASLFSFLFFSTTTQAITPKKYALIVVDVQYDFMQLPFYDSLTASFFTQGSLAVGNTGWDYVFQVNHCIMKLRLLGVRIVFTRDFHPAGHMSFAPSWFDAQGNVVAWVPGSQMHADFKPNPAGACADIIFVNTNQYMWPVHCVQGTEGSRIVAQVQSEDLVVPKGMNPRFDSYSGFKDDGGTETGMTAKLKKEGITDVFVIGIATDYCVCFTGLDAISAGFTTHVIPEFCRGVMPTTSMAALDKMCAAGASLCTLEGACELASGPQK